MKTFNLKFCGIEVNIQQRNIILLVEDNFEKSLETLRCANRFRTNDKYSEDFPTTISFIIDGITTKHKFKQKVNFDFMYETPQKPVSFSLGLVEEMTIKNVQIIDSFDFT